MYLVYVGVGTERIIIASGLRAHAEARDIVLAVRAYDPQVNARIDAQESESDPWVHSVVEKALALAYVTGRLNAS